MATTTTNPVNILIIKVDQRHPEYSIFICREVGREYPYIIVGNDDRVVTTQIRLAEHHWTIDVIDNVVIKAIKKIEAETPEERKERLSDMWPEVEK